MVRFMPNKKYNIGLYIGRFQPFHNGHLYMVQEALKQCEFLIIAIGSAQEKRTEKNPFDDYERYRFIRSALHADGYHITKDYIIIGINDREDKADNSSWGEYLMKQVLVQTGYLPDVCFTGEEQIRQHWFDTVAIDEVAIKRDIIPVSATQVREAVKNNDQKLFESLVPRGVRVWWEEIKEVLCNEQKR